MAFYKTDSNKQLQKIAGNIHTIQESSGSALPSDVVRDAYYVHTDNNYTSIDKNKLATVEEGANRLVLQDILNAIYPVGSIIMSVSLTTAAEVQAKFGGTWEKYAAGRTIIGEGTSDKTFTAGTTSGSSTHKLVESELPSHKHGMQDSGSHSHAFSYGGGALCVDTEQAVGTSSGLGTGSLWGSRNKSVSPIASSGSHSHTINSTGGGTAHNNLPPYIVTYIWVRTA